MRSTTISGILLAILILESATLSEGRPNIFSGQPKEKEPASRPRKLFDFFNNKKEADEKEVIIVTRDPEPVETPHYNPSPIVIVKKEKTPVVQPIIFDKYNNRRRPQWPEYTSEDWSHDYSAEHHGTRRRPYRPFRKEEFHHYMFGIQKPVVSVPHYPYQPYPWDIYSQPPHFWGPSTYSGG